MIKLAAIIIVSANFDGGSILASHSSLRRCSKEQELKRSQFNSSFNFQSPVMNRLFWSLCDYSRVMVLSTMRSSDATTLVVPKTFGRSLLCFSLLFHSVDFFCSQFLGHIIEYRVSNPCKKCIWEGADEVVANDNHVGPEIHMEENLNKIDALEGDNCCGEVNVYGDDNGSDPTKVEKDRAGNPAQILQLERVEGGDHRRMDTTQNLTCGAGFSTLNQSSITSISMSLSRPSPQAAVGVQLFLLLSAPSIIQALVLPAPSSPGDFIDVFVGPCNIGITNTNSTTHSENRHSNNATSSMWPASVQWASNRSTITIAFANTEPFECYQLVALFISQSTAKFGWYTVGLCVAKETNRNRI